jgi:hypothetical protein
MSILKISALFIAVVLGITAAAPKAAADQYDKKMVITFADPVEVPGGVTLTPGTYVFKLQDSQNDRHIVLVQNEREDKTFAQIFATAAFKVEPKGKVRTMFWEAPAGQPKPLRAIFWPGDHYGQAFLYKTDRANQLTGE